MGWIVAITRNKEMTSHITMDISNELNSSLLDVYSFHLYLLLFDVCTSAENCKFGLKNPKKIERNGVFFHI